MNILGEQTRSHTIKHVIIAQRDFDKCDIKVKVKNKTWVQR